MKNVLLTTTALVAFAGAAAADVSWSGSAEIGYNDEYMDSLEGTEGYSDHENIYFDADIDVLLSSSTDLDNGYTATVSYGIDISSDDVAGDNYPEISISNGMYSLSLGDTGAASDHFSKVTGMSNGLADTDGESQVLRADAAFATFEASVSYVVNDYAEESDDVTVTDEDLSFGVSGSFDAFTFGVGYDLEEHEEAGNQDSPTEDNWGVSAGFTFGAATISAAYASDGIESMGVGVDYDLGNGLVVGATYATNTDEEDTYGVTADYAAGALTVSAAYLMDDENEEISGEVSYDVGNGLVVMAGFSDQSIDDDGEDNNQWVAATYDLGGGVSVLLAYATDDAVAATKEIGPNDYYEGITLEVSMKF